jgi:hypothetical protein
MLKFLISILFVCLLPWSVCADQTSTSCTTTDINTKIGLMSAGETLTLNCSVATWTSPITVDRAITITGNGPSATTITANSSQLMNVAIPTGTYTIPSFVIKNIGFAGDCDGASCFSIDGTDGGSQDFSVVVDNVKIRNMTTSNGNVFVLGWYSKSYGANKYTTTTSPRYVVFTRLDVDTTSLAKLIMYYGRNDSWLRDDLYGTRDFLFIEGSTLIFRSTDSGGRTIIDTDNGARVVGRYNTIYNGTFQSHDMGCYTSSSGNRIQDIYMNVMDAANASAVGVAMVGGTGVAHDNVISTGYTFPGLAAVYRADACGWPTKPPNTSSKMCSNFMSYCSATMGNSGSPCLGYWDCIGGTVAGDCLTTCTTDAECGANTCVRIDGNGTGGYPSRNQTGTGVYNGSFANTVAPWYWWNNYTTTEKTVLANPGFSGQYSDYISFDADIFKQGASFNGTTGIGVGTSRPTCASGCTLGVGYFDTSANTLYKLTAPSTWTAVYTGGYTCPHPLSGLTGGCSNSIAGIDGYNVSIGSATGATITGGTMR